MMTMDQEIKNIKKLKKELIASKIIDLKNDLEKSTTMAESTREDIKEEIKEESKEKKSKLSILLDSKEEKKVKKKKMKKKKEEVKKQEKEEEIVLENKSISTFSSSSIDTKLASEALKIIKENVIFTKVVRLRKGAFSLTNNQYLRIKEYIEARISIDKKPSKEIETMDMFVLATNMHLWARKYGTPLMKQMSKDMLQVIHDYEEYAQPEQPVNEYVKPKTISVPIDVVNKVKEKQENDKKIDGTTTKEVQKVIKKEEEKLDKADQFSLKEIMRQEERKKEIKSNRKWNEKRDYIKEKNIERRFKINMKNQKYYQDRNYKHNQKRYNYQKTKDKYLYNRDFGEKKDDYKETLEEFWKRTGCI